MLESIGDAYQVPVDFDETIASALRALADKENRLYEQALPNASISKTRARLVPERVNAQCVHVAVAVSQLAPKGVRSSNRAGSPSSTFSDS